MLEVLKKSKNMINFILGLKSKFNHFIRFIIFINFYKNF